MSALMRFVTRADRVSLSPTLISSTATVSFSLIMGITPHCRSVKSVLCALVYLFLSLISSCVNNT